MRKAIAAFFLICLSFAVARAARVESITILSEYGWGEDERALQSVWRVSERNGKYYAGDKEISGKLIVRLETALAAARIPALDFANLGINQAWLDRNAAAAFPECCADNGIRATRTHRRLFSKTFRDLRLMKEIIGNQIQNRYADENRSVEITIKRTNEIVRWTTNGQAAFMLPWQNLSADERFLTYNADISRAVADLLPANFANRDLLTGINLRRDVSPSVIEAVVDRLQKNRKPQRLENHRRAQKNVRLGFAGGQDKPASYFNGKFKLESANIDSDEKDVSCSHFKLSASRAKRFFKRAKAIDGEELHREYLHLPCSASGTINFKNQTYDWKIFEGATAKIVAPNGEQIDLGCKKCGKPFQHEQH